MKSPVNKKVILASASPRRRELLQTIVPDFELAPNRKIDEVYPHELPASEVAGYISREKAEAYSDLVDDNTLVITADTVVACDGEIFGKPHTPEEARQMLRRLSGRSHFVYTGVTVHGKDKTVSFTDCTEVKFAPLSDEEIESYVNEMHPFDKAGAYGIQEWIGYIGVESITGCYYNVMGLPVQKLYRALKEFTCRR